MPSFEKKKLKIRNEANKKKYGAYTEETETIPEKAQTLALLNKNFKKCFT